MKRANTFRGLAAVMAFLMFASVSGSVVMFSNAGMINQALNLTTSSVVNGENEGNEKHDVLFQRIW
jgi:hypothetical protein